MDIKNVLDIVVTGVFWLILLGIPACAYLYIRNEWVYNQRIDRIGTDEYDLLPSYDEMMIKYWYCWSVRKMIELHNKR